MSTEDRESSREYQYPSPMVEAAVNRYNIEMCVLEEPSVPKETSRPSYMYTANVLEVQRALKVHCCASISVEAINIVVSDLLSRGQIQRVSNGGRWKTTDSGRQLADALCTSEFRNLMIQDW